MATFDDFMKLDIRVGEIIKSEIFDGVKKPAYKVWVDFGDEIRIKKSSAQITQCYNVEDLVGRQILGVVNFPPKQVSTFISEVLILGVYSNQGVVLIQPDRKVDKGDKLG